MENTVWLSWPDGIFNPCKSLTSGFGERGCLVTCHKGSCQDGKLVSTRVLNFLHLNRIEWLTFWKDIRCPCFSFSSSVVLSKSHLPLSFNHRVHSSWRLPLYLISTLDTLLCSHTRNCTSVVTILFIQ